MEHAPIESTELVDIILRLTRIVDNLCAFAERLEEDKENVHSRRIQTEPEITEAVEGQELLTERLLLIEAWKELEAEQREFALQSKGSRKLTPTKTTYAQVPKNQFTFDQEQFAYLQQECSRSRNHDSRR